MISNIALEILREMVSTYKLKVFNNLVLSIEKMFPMEGGNNTLVRMYSALDGFRLSTISELGMFKERDKKEQISYLLNRLHLLHLSDEMKKLVLECLDDPTFKNSTEKLSENELIDYLSSHNILKKCDLCTNGVYQGNRFIQCDVIDKINIPISVDCSRFILIKNNE